MGIELEEVLYDSRLEEGLVSNAGKMIVNGVKQAGAAIAKGVNNVVTSSNDAAAASDAKTADAQAQADQSKLDKVISGKSGISLAGQDKQTKATVSAVNAIISEIDTKISALNGPAQAPAEGAPDDQVKEALAFVDTLSGRLQEDDQGDSKKEIAALTKFKDGLAKSLQSGVFSGKGLKTITDNLGKLLGDEQKAKALTDPLNQAYSAALDTQYKQYQKKVAQQKEQPKEATPSPATQQAQPSQAQAQAPQTPPTKPEQAPTGQAPEQKTGPEQADGQLKKAQDVIKKCSNALGQISSSIDAIKSSAPAANFGQPSKDGFYSGVAGDTYIDQVKNIVSKVASDLNGYVMMKETEEKLNELARLMEQLKAE